MGIPEEINLEWKELAHGLEERIVNDVNCVKNPLGGKDLR